MFGENKKYHYIGIAYFQYEMTMEKSAAVTGNRVLANEDAIRLGNYAFAYCFREYC